MPIRKNIRLENYDYSQNGAYHITICTFKNANILGKIHKNSDETAFVELSEIGCVVRKTIEDIESHYEKVFVVNYVIMPDHVHLLLQIDNDGWRQIVAPTISKIIMQFKRVTSIKIGKSIWQKGFYDHIIRNEFDFEETYQYIQNNPQRWSNNNTVGATTCRPKMKKY